MRIVFDDQQHLSPGWICIAVVGNVFLARRRQDHRACAEAGCVIVAAVRADIGQRQIERERAALARRAEQADFAAQQRRQFAGDGQAQARAAVFAAGAGVGLLERLEDQLLFFRRDADARVADGKGNDVLARCSAPDVPGVQPVGASAT